MIREQTFPDAETAAASRSAAVDAVPPRPGLGSLMHDLIALAELQGQLLVQDLHEMRKGSGIGMTMVATGMILAFASVPVLLVGLGWMFADFVEWPIWGGILVVSGVIGVLPAIALMIGGWLALQKNSTVITRSTSELRENTRWLKRRLRNSF